ncbi:hypothetical protein DND132_3140 [Pseudodesulfovibrio mercurii]|uniref:Uncharacterized protein n=1 Tax=Pseudodesulfovibrio mercurii TaxID=641491 RepID=F0JK94_9BACT|nr:hypothetical protein [Pseudodesulfovibrio mercurii]EGB16343.1 hypothetical protein DND132_3140 [Pseudodesulfovibrio mercurii]
MFNKIRNTISDKIDRNKEIKEIKDGYQKQYGVLVEEFLDKIGTDSLKPFGLNYHLDKELDVDLNKCGWMLFARSKVSRLGSGIVGGAVELFALAHDVAGPVWDNNLSEDMRPFTERCREKVSDSLISIVPANGYWSINVVGEVFKTDNLAAESLNNMYDVLTTYINSVCFDVVDYQLPDFKSATPKCIIESFFESRQGMMFKCPRESSLFWESSKQEKKYYQYCHELFGLRVKTKRNVEKTSYDVNGLSYKENVTGKWASVVVSGVIRTIVNGTMIDQEFPATKYNLKFDDCGWCIVDYDHVDA